ncbi:MAG: RNA-binding cell elongation regulator Jag/EloR [Acidimicrobiia bacterium]
MEWVEVRGKSVEVAVQAGLDELGLESVDGADVEVIQEAERGFLGLGAQDAIVRVKPKPKGRRRRSRRGKREGEERRRRGAGASVGRSGGSRQDVQREVTEEEKDVEPEVKPGSGSRGEDASAGGPMEPSLEDQGAVVREFLEGLLDAFGLEGVVAMGVEEDVIYADVTGEQTEALVGAKGTIMQATLELCRTVVQRKTQAGARIRLDIAGYGERRREALRIYVGKLSEKVVQERNEIMLEAMNPADRKVVHDAVAEIEGVRSYSEGEEPNRSVVVALDPGVGEEGAGAESEEE